MINRPVFGFANSDDFAAIVTAAASGSAALLKKLVDLHGPIGGPVAAAELGKSMVRNFSGFATEPFYSALPICVGPFAGKVRLLPRETKTHLSSRLDFAKDMADRLADHDVSYELPLRFFVEERLTPIEHRPLGEIMRARRDTYYASQKRRGALGT